MQDFFKAAINDMAASSLRCVAIAYRSYELDKVPANEDNLDKWVLPEDELVLLAIVGIKVYTLKLFSSDVMDDVLSWRHVIIFMCPVVMPSNLCFSFAVCRVISHFLFKYQMSILNN